MSIISNDVSQNHAFSDGAGPRRKSRFNGNSTYQYPRLFDQIYDELSCEWIADEQLFNLLNDLIFALHQLRLNLTKREWESWIDVGRRHPIKEVLHQDPFTYRAFSKPRGYAGDAELLDFVYGREEMWPAPEATSLGLRIFNYTTLAPAPEGVRERRGFIANRIDRLAEEIDKPHILSIAAGHLREAILATAIKRKKVSRLVALDSDQLSLREIDRCYSCFGIETVPASIRQLLTGKLQLGTFDFVYSLGLFDYLCQSMGRRLVWTMFRMLRPGGRLLVANFLPGIRDVGYMEVFMDWYLVYRTRQDMMQMTMEIPQEKIKDISIFAEENQNIIFLEVAKK